MKIAYVYDVVYPYVIGGVEKRIWEVATRLVKRGHEVTLFGMKYWKGEDVIYKDGVRIWGVCQEQPLYINGRRSIKGALYFALTVIAPLLKEKFDIIDCQNFPYFPCFSTKLVSVLRKSPFIITWHEVWGNYWYNYMGKVGGSLGKLTERMCYKLPDRSMAISHRIKSDLIAQGVPQNRIDVVYVGTDWHGIQKISPVGEEHEIIYVGRLVFYKNVDVLIRVVALLKSQIPNIRCAIIGDGPEKEKLMDLSNQLNLHQNIQFLGVMPNEAVISHLKSSKVFVLPSTLEGLPQVILEANASGLPVIIIEDENNAAVDIVKNGENGFKVELSKDAIGDKVLQILENEELHKNMALSASRHAERYDWQKIVDKLEQVYQDVAGGY